MWLAFVSTAFLMGLMGGAHCLAMCAAPCGALTGQGAALSTGGQGVVVRWMPRGSLLQRTFSFHLGRLAGYGAAGALAAYAMAQFAWLSQTTSALHPLWTMLHVLILAWGGLMMLQARQPAWIESAGRSAWARVRQLVSRPGGLFMTGFAWALMPCGLLYTALLTAALSGSVLRGMLCMVLFGMGSGMWLVAGPWAWRRLRARFDGQGGNWGSRLAGLVLFTLGTWALWMDVVHGEPAPWCVP